MFVRELLPPDLERLFYGKLERRPFYNRYGVFVFIEETFFIEIQSFGSLHSESSLTTQSLLLSQYSYSILCYSEALFTDPETDIHQHNERLPKIF